MEDAKAASSPTAGRGGGHDDDDLTGVDNNTDYQIPSWQS